ncbi:MAG: sugar transferase [Patescibacteria group bacterium]
MKFLGKRESLILLVGDLFFFTVSLWLALFFRNFSLPSGKLFYTHLVPFSVLFIVSVTVFYIAGLYGKHTTVLRSKLPSTLLNAQFSNSVIAIIFFYLTPFFGITPKTILFIYLAISFVVVLAWRVYGYFLLGSKRVDNIVILGSGEEVTKLQEEINRNDVYNLRLVSKVVEASIVVIDFSDETVKIRLPNLYERIFSGVNFVDMHKMYEDIFDRVPLSLLKHNWFLENISNQPRAVYDSLKRLMDIVFSFVLGVVSLLVYPFVILAIKLDDGGPVFITQERVGQGNRLVKIHKFRSMSRNDAGDYKNNSDENKITRVGGFLRRSRIDELPQLWNVLVGDISLIGPRPELPALAQTYEKQIPYYNIRHIIKPGLSGWAQIYQENHPHHKEAVDETKEKLTYDLYYIKERSLLLDLKIALRTIKTLLSRVGV